MAPLEGGTVVAYDWARMRQAPYVHSLSSVPSRWNCSGSPSSRGMACGSSIRGIAKRLERAASTVSREVARHGGRPEYRALEADHQAWESALRPRVPSCHSCGVAKDCCE